MKLIIVLAITAWCQAQDVGAIRTGECVKLDANGVIGTTTNCSAASKPTKSPVRTELTAQEKAELQGLTLEADRLNELVKEAEENLSTAKKEIAEAHAPVKCPPETEEATCDLPYAFEDEYAAVIVEAPVQMQKTSADAIQPAFADISTSGIDTLVVSNGTSLAATGTGTITATAITDSGIEFKNNIIQQ